jgi:hypothetical protein
MKHLFLFLNLFLFHNSNASTELHLYYNFDHCANCNSEFELLNKIDSKIKKTLFVTEKSASFIDEFLQNHHFNKSDFNIKYLKNNFFECKKINCTLPLYESFCLVIFENGNKDSFALKQLSYRLKTLSTSKSTIARIINLPDSIKISNRFQFSVTNRTINFLDETLNKNISLFLNPELNNIEKAIIIKHANFKSAYFLKIACFDTSNYRKFLPVLRSIGKQSPEIGKAFITDSTINLMLSFSYPEIINTDSNITLKLFLYSKNFKNNQSSLICVKKDGYSTKNHLDHNYTINNIQPFFIYNKKAYFSVANWLDSLDRDLLAEYDLINGQLEYKNIVPNRVKYIPNKKKKLGYDLNRYVNNNFYFVNSYPYFFDYKTNQQLIFDPNTFIHEGEQDYFISDVKKVEENIQVLCVYKKEVIQYTFNALTQKLVEKKNLSIDRNLSTDYIRYIGENKCILFDSNKIHIIDF